MITILVELKVIVI